MKLQFVGCGDAFGSGGRLNTCFHLTGQSANLLIDCGASSMIGLNRLGIDRNAVRLIVVTHFHADHFGGIPFFILDAQFVSRRKEPLTIAGPKGVAGWYARVMETAFPGSSTAERDFKVDFVELGARQSTPLIDGVRVTPFPMVHSEDAGPCYGYRIELEGKVIAYSGDTAWTNELVALGRDADLFICEVYMRERKLPVHIDLSTLEAKLPEIRPKRLVLTHMSEDVLQHASELRHELAEDSKIITF